MGSSHRAKERFTGSPFDPLVRSVFPKLADSIPNSVSPNAVTFCGLLAAVLGSGALFLSRIEPAFYFAAAGSMVVNWIADTLDGVLARQRGKCTKLGDFLDHVFDAFTAVVIAVGIAGTGMANPVIIMLAGLIFLLCFAVTYKGEQVTGVYELLALGPTEVRLVLMGLFIAGYFIREPIVTVMGVGVWLFDIAGLIGIVWASVYALILTFRYGRRISDAER